MAQLLHRRDQSQAQCFGLRGVLPGGKGPQPPSSLDAVRPGIILQLQAFLLRQGGIPAPGHRDHRVGPVSVAQAAERREQQPAYGMFSCPVLFLVVEGDAVDPQVRAQHAAQFRLLRQRDCHPGPRDAFPVPLPQRRGDMLRFLPRSSACIQGNCFVRVRVPFIRNYRKQVPVQEAQRGGTVFPLPFVPDFLQPAARILQRLPESSDALVLLRVDPAVRRVRAVHGQEDRCRMHPPAQPGQQLPQVRPDAVKTVDCQIRTVPQTAAFQSPDHVGPDCPVIVKLFSDQFVIGAPDDLQVPELRTFQARIRAFGAVFQFFRGQLALADLVQRFPDPHDHAGKIRHVPVIGQVFRIF